MLMLLTFLKPYSIIFQNLCWYFKGFNWTTQDTDTQKMELHWVWMSAATLLACYFLLHTFGRRLNGWYYDMKLGEKQRLLPPGDMGWPLIGNMLSFLRDFRSGTGQPDSFIQSLVSRSLFLSLPSLHLHFLNFSILGRFFWYFYFL